METRSRKRAAAGKTRVAAWELEAGSSVTRRTRSSTSADFPSTRSAKRARLAPPAARSATRSSQKSAPVSAPAPASEPAPATRSSRRRAAMKSPAADQAGSEDKDRGQGKEEAKGKSKDDTKGKCKEDVKATGKEDAKGKGKEEMKGKGKEEMKPKGNGEDKEICKQEERAAERALMEKAVAAAAGLAGKDDNDALQQNLASASSALHGLLRKLGAGLDDLLPSGSGAVGNGRLKSILSGLRAEGDEARQLDSLTQLCEVLSIGTEESLSSFSVDSFVPVLVGLLNCEYNPDIMLLAARALTHLTDVLPSSCAAVVHYGAVPLFCARLLTIEYIDLAEQSLQALQKISHEHPTAVLRAGGLMAVLSYLDFFSTGVQRVAVTTAANVCRQLPADAAELVSDCIPILTNLLQYQDAKVVEHACTCLTRLAENFSASPEHLEMLCSHGLVPQVVRLISVTSGNNGGQAPISSSTYTGLVRLLATCAAGSPAVSESLLECGISGVLRDVLAGAGAALGSSARAPSLSRPPEQLSEIVSLVNELLPSIPEGEVLPTGPKSVSATAEPAGVPATRASRRRAGQKEENADKEDTAIAVRLQAAKNPNSQLSPREKFLQDHQDLLMCFGRDLLPILIQVYGSSVNPSVRLKTISAICKLLHFSSTDMLKTLLKDLNISSFLAGVLSSKDTTLILSALQMAEILMEKLPDIFRKQFFREGVVHAVDNFLASEKPLGGSLETTTAAPAPSPASAPSDAGPGSEQPPRPLRSTFARRRADSAKEGNDNQQEPLKLGAVGASASGGLQGASRIPASTGVEPALRSSRLGLRTVALARAKHFKEAHFSTASGGSGAGVVTEGLQKLKELCAKLTGEGLESESKSSLKRQLAGTEQSIPEDSVAVEAIKEVLSMLVEGEGVSTFEFIGSGVVAALLRFLTGEDVVESSKGKELVGNGVPEAQQQAVVKRLRQFVEVALPAQKAQDAAPMAALVRMLQNSLASTERFPVVLSHAPRSYGHGGVMSSGLSSLTQPFKLRLCRAPDEKLLRDYSSNVVLIEPLATVGAVEDFLWARVKRPEVPAPRLDDSGPAAATPSEPPPAPPSDASPPKPPSQSFPEPMSPPSPPTTRARAAAAAARAGRSTEKKPEAKGQGSESTAADKGKGKVRVGAQGQAERPEQGVAGLPDGSGTLPQAATGDAERSKGPQTRAQKRAALANLLRGPNEGAVNMFSEDEALATEQHLAFDEAVAMDEDEPSDEDDEEHDEDDDMEEEEEDEEVFGAEAVQVCAGDRVHDVKLGTDPTENTPAATSAPGGSSARQQEEAAAGSVGAKAEADAGPSTSGQVNEGFAGLAKELDSIGGGGTSLVSAMAAMAAAAAGQGGAQTGFRERRSMAAVAAAAAPPRLTFTLEGRPLERTSTIFQAIQQQAVARQEEEEQNGHEDGGHSGRRMWDEVHSIMYRRVENEGEATGKGPAVKVEEASTSGAQAAERTGTAAQPADPLLALALPNFPFTLDKKKPPVEILQLLRILEGCNRLAPSLRSLAAVQAVASGQAEALADVSTSGLLVLQEDFLSSKLTSKLARQMQDALALCSGGLPSWCQQLTVACPFLFPFETRRQYFYSTAFGLSRALQRLQQQEHTGGRHDHHHHHSRELRVGRLQRQKVRVSRDRILDSAMKVMELYCSHKAVLEVEYFNEVGTGLGPTLEFYTLLSHELQRTKLNLWRSSAEKITEPEPVKDADVADGMDLDGAAAVEVVDAGKAKPETEVIAEPRTVEHVHAPHGLFPRPWPAAIGAHRAKVVEHFRLLGRTMAKALQDNRLLDLPFSNSFYKLLLGKELDLFDVKEFEPELGRTVEEMHALAERRKVLEAAPEDNAAGILTLYFRGSTIDDLCLDFTLPGYPDYQLKPDGADEVVTLANLDEYVHLVVDATVKTGIAAQMEAFKAGFNQVFDLDTLRIFSEDELEGLLCGRREMWTADSLVDNIKFDHGYNASSPPIRNLLEIMGELSPEQQRLFLQFVTGAPRLPPGGLASLNPKLTIVRKHPTGGGGALGTTPPGAASAMGTTLADGDLPSVMTCANYLKLPPHSCKAVMKERLLYAIQEGQGSFDLS